MTALLALGCAKILGFQPGQRALEREEAVQGGAQPATDTQAGGMPPSGHAGVGGRASSGEAGQPGEAGSAPASTCGNQRLDSGEECDGDELLGATCTSLGNAAGGKLRCENCEYDLSECYHVRSLDVSSHACAVLTNDKLKCWGANYWGQLGLGDDEMRGEEPGEMGDALPFVDLGGRRVLQVATGEGHTCAVVEGDDVVCWGLNSDGQLGQPGDDVLAPRVDGKVDLGEGAIVAVAAGAAHTCALFEVGRVKCWGGNQYGQLGLGHDQSRGKGFGEMGDSLEFVDLGSDFSSDPVKIRAISAGAYHTCATTRFGAVKCWGRNWEGVLGIGSNKERHGAAPDELGDHLPFVDLGGWTAEQLSAGAEHNCIRWGLAGDTLKCWGYNGDGQLGMGDYASRGSLPGEMGSALPSVYLGIGFSQNGVSAGVSHTCAWSIRDGVKCWGSNLGGALGLGDTESRGYLPEQMGTKLPFVNLGPSSEITSVHAGNGATCAILDPGRVKCWGLNGAATLGAGHRDSVGVAPEQMGDALPFVEL